MKKVYFAPTLLAVVALVAACGSVSTTSLLDQTRSDYRMAQNNPKVAAYAPLELKQAADALARANAEAGDNSSAEKIDQLAYLVLDRKPDFPNEGGAFCQTKIFRKSPIEANPGG